KHYDTGLGDKGGQLFDERNLLRWSTFILAFTLIIKGNSSRIW
ncbi:hypothetical protein C8K15_1631, partial [Paenisporosarcina sp. OV554]